MSVQPGTMEEWVEVMKVPCASCGAEVDKTCTVFQAVSSRYGKGVAKPHWPRIQYSRWKRGWTTHAYGIKQAKNVEKTLKAKGLL